MASLTRRSAKVRTKASRVQEIVKTARKQKIVTSALVEVHSKFQAKSSTLDTQVKTKFNTTTVGVILKGLWLAIRMVSMFSKQSIPI